MGVTLAIGVFAASGPACAGDKRLEGKVSIDGSSTVYPITEAMAEEFRTPQPKVRVTVGISGTGGGFKKFCAGETVISDASRPIKSSEVAACKAAGIDYIELPVAFDGLSVVVSTANTWASALTVDELRKIWRQGDKMAKLWSDVRPNWPKEPIRLYGPGTDSGTFDYFVEAIVGDAKEGHFIRPDFTASEDDNVLVQGIAGDRYSLGFFGFAYYVENQDKLKAIKIDGGKGPVGPSMETINNGTYSPLSRPLFIYVSTKAADRPEVKSFVTFYLDNATKLVPQVGYVPLPAKAYDLVRERFAKHKTGSLFHGVEVGMKIEDILSREHGS
ncbi:PstS family phosphate ABC transporter substrate-binding protein [bacterium]|nr:PstS family phosphate ABC transporter substrate-binding protein [bacterium]